MDLSIFHFNEGPDRNYKPKDYLNGRRGLMACRFLEWSGWYSQDIAQRLLGHYRLYQHYRSGMRNWPVGLAPARSYILHYKAIHPFKYALARCMSFLYSLIFWKEPFLPGMVAGLNHRLIREGSTLLEEFLVSADDDFEKALNKALQQIRESSFFQDGHHEVLQSIHLSQTNHKYNLAATFNDNRTKVGQLKTYTDNSTKHLHQDNSAPQIFNHIEFQRVITQAPTGPHGKEKGVFSKRQILIMLDLLSLKAKKDGIDLSKQNRFNAYADLLRGITGKGKATLLEELNDYRNKDLYACNTQGELGQLIIIMTDLGNTFRDAGFRSLSDVVDRKIIELRQKKIE